jgi:intron-binding protein aquarius
MASHSLSATYNDRPSAQDLQEGNRWVDTAQKLWLGAGDVKKIRQDVIKRELWDSLEEENFAPRSLLILENLHVLEKYGYHSR